MVNRKMYALSRVVTTLGTEQNLTFQYEPSFRFQYPSGVADGDWHDPDMIRLDQWHMWEFYFRVKTTGSARNSTNHFFLEYNGDGTSTNYYAGYGVWHSTSYLKGSSNANNVMPWSIADSDWTGSDDWTYAIGRVHNPTHSHNWKMFLWDFTLWNNTDGYLIAGTSEVAWKSTVPLWQVNFRSNFPLVAGSTMEVYGYGRDG